MTEKRYTPEEVERILSRAAELDTGHTSAESDLTLDQLLDIAEETGIDRRAMIAAATESELDSPAVQSNPFLGGPTKIERNLTAFVGDEYELSELALDLNDAFDDIGRPQVTNDRLQWHSSGTNGRLIQVRAQKRNDILTVTITEPLGGLVGGIFGGVGGGVGGGLGGGLAWLFGMLFGGIGALLWVIFSVVFALSLARFIYSRSCAHRQQTIDDSMRMLADTLSNRGEETVFSQEEAGQSTTVAEFEEQTS